MTYKRLTAIAYAALLITVFVLLGLCAMYSIEAEDARAENLRLRQQILETEAHDTDLRAKLVSLSDEYHTLYNACTPEINEPAWQPAGEFTICHYCSCDECCSKHDGITASGVPAEMGRTVAVDPDVIPLGSEVLLNGVAYVAEDTGVHGHVIDVYIDRHEQAAAMGTYRANICWREVTDNG